MGVPTHSSVRNDGGQVLRRLSIGDNSGAIDAPPSLLARAAFIMVVWIDSPQP